VKIELINTGSELLLGRVLNTHQQWICRGLADLGYEVSRQVCVADDGPSIQAAAGEALGRADLVIVTGGLGPTSDDLTRDLIARMLGRKLVFVPEVLAKIEAYFAARNRPPPPNSQLQAMVLEGARVLPNHNGTAPGQAIACEPNPFSPAGGKAMLILLPGPPRELRPMFTESVLPLIQREMPLGAKFVCRTLRTAGLGESLVETKIAPPLEPSVREGLEIGYCARIGEVDVRLIARGDRAAEIVANAEQIVRDQLGDALIFGVDDDSMESVVVGLLTRQGKTLALAESCTGGLIANRITNVPGASRVFIAGLVTYSNDAKQSLLGVRRESLEAHGAVSETVAREMAEGARARLGTDYAISVTGVAGPSGGTADKPVGTVFMAVARRDGQTLVRRQFNNFDRETFKFVTSQQALTLLREQLVS
jgi:nicotinamide-nucleotide amidase